MQQPYVYPPTVILVEPDAPRDLEDILAAVDAGEPITRAEQRLLAAALRHKTLAKPAATPVQRRFWR
jgi:hypothetical protein